MKRAKIEANAALPRAIPEAAPSGNDAEVAALAPPAELGADVDMEGAEEEAQTHDVEFEDID